MLSINSKDDPIIPTHSIPREELVENENCIHIETNGGGHVEFLSQLKPRMVVLNLKI
jgi:predicted alpha/beta-fold hydrolase